MSESIPIPNEFDDDSDFWPRPIYDRWEANRLGIVRHVKDKKDLGRLNNSEYLQIGIRDQGIKKGYYKHRFIFECFHGKINDAKLVVDRINNIKTDNRLENLQLITQSKNIKKDNRKGKNRPPAIRVRAINTNTGESSDYDSITKCGKRLDINPASISDVLKGRQKTATSKLDKNKYKFEKLD